MLLGVARRRCLFDRDTHRHLLGVRELRNHIGLDRRELWCAVVFDLRDQIVSHGCNGCVVGHRRSVGTLGAVAVLECERLVRRQPAVT